MIKPPYFRQEKNATCSLAVLRMALAFYGNTKTEKDLVEQVAADYGMDFTNIYNPTIAKLACDNKIDTEMYALWPVYKKNNLKDALVTYKNHKATMDMQKYENPNDNDSTPEPLSIAYRDMFKAIEKGCKVRYGSLTEKRIRKLLDKNALIQTSIKLEKLYPGKKKAYHSILIYGYKNNTIYFHDPSYGAELKSTFKQLKAAVQDVGAGIIYKGIKI